MVIDDHNAADVFMTFASPQVDLGVGPHPPTLHDMCDRAAQLYGMAHCVVCGQSHRVCVCVWEGGGL